MSNTTVNEATLDSLVGIHKLDAVDFGSMRIKPNEWCDEEECNTVSFRIDGVVYTAYENPSDGYRSSMDKLLIEKKRLKNKFATVKVMGIKKPDGYDKNDTIQFYDALNGKLVLEIGTDRQDDYYPTFVANFLPQNMAVNAEVKP